jgi:tRNA pseudouridine13 synthase
VVKFGESDAGIIEYMSEGNVEMKCVLKHRYSDFIVNEIDPTGEVVYLKLEPEQSKIEAEARVAKPGELTASEAALLEAAGKKDLVPMSENTIVEMEKLLDEERSTKLKEYIENIND